MVRHIIRQWLILLFSHVLLDGKLKSIDTSGFFLILFILGGLEFLLMFLIELVYILSLIQESLLVNSHIISTFKITIVDVLIVGVDVFRCAIPIGESSLAKLIGFSSSREEEGNN